MTEGRSTRTYVTDLAERVLVTFVEAVLAILVFAGPADLVDVSFWKGAAWAGLAAVFALLKGLLAAPVGNRSSASLLR